MASGQNLPGQPSGIQAAGPIFRQRPQMEFYSPVGLNFITGDSLSSGFCVICENDEAIENIFSHMAYFHKQIAVLSRPKVYCVRGFEDRRIMVPIGTRAEELSDKRCGACDGVFFRHRFTNHSCHIMIDGIDEGEGPHYCLLCQLRTSNIMEHWSDAHFMNQTYHVAIIRQTQTLLPRHTDDSELENNVACICDKGCVTFTYRNRLTRPCPDQHLF